jgi:glycosyltransferase involved in cell wall biosynthesis
VKISWIAGGDAGWMSPVVDYMNSNGHDIVLNEADESFDILFGATIGAQQKITELHLRYPNVAMTNYNWDVYEWAYKNWPSNIFPYDLKNYHALLERSASVICPSMSVVYRNEEFFNISREKSKVVKSFARQLEITPKQVRDDRFVYMPLRQIPDRNLGWFEKAVKELDIPFLLTDKKLSEEEYTDKIASCSFLVCPWFEASTGGLSLLEGYAVGKSVLVSDSRYMGAADYFGDRANYFKHDNYEDFKICLSRLWDNTPTLDLDDCKEFSEEYKPEVMANSLVKAFEEIL